ncbi:MAG: hypothetical protein IJY91_01110 [Oscillospiraceae bacterium]|nr:hypothetical protein [Oscillospiraceae bacterium]
MDNKEETFQYTYSAKEQAEVARIRKKYLPSEEDKMEQLRKLDHSASQKAQAWAIALGIIGALILGSGMSLFMSDLGEWLGSYQNLSMIIGIIIGVIGLVLVALAYPVYNRILKKERQRIAPEILRLTDELMK